MLHRLLYTISALLAFYGLLLLSRAPNAGIAALDLVGYGADYIMWSLLSAIAGFTLHFLVLVWRTRDLR